MTAGKHGSDTGAPGARELPGKRRESDEQRVGERSGKGVRVELGAASNREHAGLRRKRGGHSWAAASGQGSRRTPSRARTLRVVTGDRENRRGRRERWPTICGQARGAARSVGGRRPERAQREKGKRGEAEEVNTEERRRAARGGGGLAGGQVCSLESVQGGSRVRTGRGMCRAG